MSETGFVFTTDNKVKMYSSEAEINDKLSSIIGEKFIEYRKKFNAASNFELRTEFPLYMQVELNQICNLRCPMCSITIPKARQKYITEERMNWDTYKKIIIEGEKYGCPSMNPQGTNEPLLDPKFEDYIKFASQHGFIDISMNTNATLLSEERANKLLESGVTRLRFSLDAATKETYEKIRIGAKFEPVMKNIERFLEIKQRGGYELPVVGVNLCRMKINEHEIDQFIEMWKDKVDLVAIQNFIAPDFETDYTDFIPTNSEYHKNLKENFRCEQPWQRVYIKSNGEVCPCCPFFNEELSLGNIEEHTIHELWNGQKMKMLQDLHKEGRYYDNPVCSNCVKCTMGVKDNSELVNIKK